MAPSIQRPWLRAAAWLAFLGPFFFLTYNAANDYAASLEHVPSVVFTWEGHLPFMAWTIVPYWSCDLLYAVSLALCRTRQELDRHAGRLLAIQLFSVVCFVVFPLRVLYERPQLDGLTGDLFGILTSFDQPFNQAPSLHVSLAVILWVCYRRVLRGWARFVAGAWLTLIAISAWTTYQHQFIDLPLGFWAGLLVIAAIPEQSFAEARRPKLSALYLSAAMALLCVALLWRGPMWLALWPSFALSMVACAYWTGDPAWLSKRDGRIAFWMWPYTLCAWINSRLWTRGQQPWQHLADGVWIGRAPDPGAAFATVIDLTAEMPIRARHNIQVLDLTVPSRHQVLAAVAAIQAAERPTLVCCALGYSRSATVSAAWLIEAGYADSAEDAIEKVRQVRPWIVMKREALHRVQECVQPAHHN